jgi:cbb3-type cytochrome oxidase subunit 3
LAAMSHGTKQSIALVTFLLLSVVVRVAIYYQRELGVSEYVKAALVVFWLLGLCVGVYWYILDLQKQREERDRHK